MNDIYIIDIIERYINLDFTCTIYFYLDAFSDSDLDMKVKSEKKTILMHKLGFLKIFDITFKSIVSNHQKYISFFGSSNEPRLTCYNIKNESAL